MLIIFTDALCFLYSFKFKLQNPLCQQLGQPVCIRARNINVGYENGISIPRRLMDHDLVTVPSAVDATAGHAAPLLIFQTIITHSSLIHSSPWPSANNTLTVTFMTKVPLPATASATGTNLVDSVTTETGRQATWTKAGSGSSSTLSGSWDSSLAQFVFTIPADTDADSNYSAVRVLTPKNRCIDHVQMRRQFAVFALEAPARAGAVNTTVNVKAAVDTLHIISTATLVVIHAVLIVSAVGFWTLRPQKTHDRAIGPAKSQAKMQPRDLPARATTFCKANKARKKSTAASMALTGWLLGTLVLAAQVGPARAYDCTSDAECAYEGCNDISCSSSSSYCNNGVWDAKCVSTTYISTTKQAETLCTVLSLSRITLLWRVLESGD